MKEIKKYTSVIRCGKDGTKDALMPGSYISITEKIDCANASFVLDMNNPMGITCYSRNSALNTENRLRGFYDWVKEKIAPIKDILNPNYRYFGEWTCSHKVVYKPEVYNNFYMFRIWDEEASEYLSDEVVKSEAARLGILTVPYFYEGEFISFEHLMSFVGKSDLTVEPNTGEGIVVKNIDFRDDSGKQMFLKLVSERFAEIKKQKTPKNPGQKNEIQEAVESVLTKARVDKILYKLIDEGKLPEVLEIEDMGKILKTIGTRVYDDIIKEESEILSSYEEKNVQKAINKRTPHLVRVIIGEHSK